MGQACFPARTLTGALIDGSRKNKGAPDRCHLQRDGALSSKGKPRSKKDVDLELCLLGVSVLSSCLSPEPFRCGGHMAQEMEGMGETSGTRKCCWRR